MHRLAIKMVLASALVLGACGDDDGEAPDLTEDGSAATAPTASQDAGLKTNLDSGPAKLPPTTEPSVPDAGSVPVLSNKVGCEAIEMAPPKDGLQIEMPLPVPAANEREYCMLVLVDRDMALNWTDGRYTKGSHHGTMYRTVYKDKIPTVTVTGETVLDATKPHVCPTPTATWQVNGVIGTGRPVTRATLDANGNPEPGVKLLPEDVAVKIKKGDVLLINFHMINASEKPLESCFKLNLHAIPEAQVKFEAGLLFTYNTMVTVPPMGESTARMACPVTKDVSLSAAASHMHARGDGYLANLLDKAPTDPTAKVVTELYKGTEWDDPKVRVYEQPLALKAGQYIDYQCHYTNKEARSISQGYASSDEMCMFIGTYWPRDAKFEVCQNDTSKSQSATNGIVYGYGDKSGADFLQCYWGLKNPVYEGGFDDPNRYATLGCFTHTCPKASPPMNPYFTCLADSSDACTDDCKAAQASFQASCSFNECKEEYGTDGSDGTCASTVGPKAVAACTKPGQLSAFTNNCVTGSCAVACTDPKSPLCTACIGTFDGSPLNASCMNILVGACAQDQGKQLATECVTECFTGCITKEITSCAVNCLNNVSCKSQYQSIAAATCN